MTLTLHLPPELEQRLTQEAKRQGLALDAYALQLLDQSLPPKDRRTELVTLLQSWIEEGDPEEQQETGEYLIRALDEDRLADRQLFPPELKGITWWAIPYCSMPAHSAWSPIRGAHGKASPVHDGCKPSWGTGAACLCQRSPTTKCVESYCVPTKREGWRASTP